MSSKANTMNFDVSRCFESKVEDDKGEEDDEEDGEEGGEKEKREREEQ